MQFYKIPITCSTLTAGKAAGRVSVRESIHENIRILLKSFFLSYRFDPTFGSVINRFQGSTRPNTKRDVLWRAEIKRQIKENLESLLQRYERRIEVDKVMVQLLSPDKYSKNENVYVKVEVRGILSLGRREKFHFPDREIVDEAREVFPLSIPVGKS